MIVLLLLAMIFVCFFFKVRLFKTVNDRLTEKAMIKHWIMGDNNIQQPIVDDCTISDVTNLIKADGLVNLYSTTEEQAAIVSLAIEIGYNNFKFKKKSKKQSKLFLALRKYAIYRHNMSEHVQMSTLKTIISEWQKIGFMNTNYNNLKRRTKEVLLYCDHVNNISQKALLFNLVNNIYSFYLNLIIDKPVSSK